MTKTFPRAYKFLRTSRFINNLYAVNDGEFSSSLKHTYLTQLELNLEHQGEQATFLDLDIKNEDNVFVYKLFDERDRLFFLYFRYSLSVEQYSNINFL